MPRILKKQLKFKCLELMCNTVHRQDKWLDHCKKKHLYKFKNKMNIKYKIIEDKIGAGPWTKRTETDNSERSVPLPQCDIPSTSAACDPSTFRENFAMISSQGKGDTLTSADTTNKKVQVNDTGDSSSDKMTSSNGNYVLSYPATETEEVRPLISVSPADKYPCHFEEMNEFVDSNTLLPLPISMKKSDPFDPATYKGLKLNEHQMNLALRLEEFKLHDSFVFPKVNKRKYSPKWRYCELPDGTMRERKWLVYSEKEDAAFCLHCLIFALPNQQSVWSTTGYNGWQLGNAVRDIEIHESSKNHLSCQIAKIQWSSQRHINKKLSEAHNIEVEHRRQVLSVVIDCCRYLSEEMLAFRKNIIDGKLFKLFKLLAKYSPDARVHYEMVEKSRQLKKKMGSNFLSYRNIFDLIAVMSKLVAERIVEKIKETNKYSIILDSTQDVSKKEATAIILRYVEENEGTVKPVERLIKVFTSGETRGSDLKVKLVECLETTGLDPRNIVGQSMDGAGNMRGRYIGLKTLISNDYKTAFYVWCSSHRFALVIEKSIDICPDIRNLFSLLEEVYVFMSGHKRHASFINNLKPTNRARRLKRVTTTRWSSKEQAVRTVLYCYDEVRTTLRDLYLDRNAEKDTVTLAQGLYGRLGDFDTVAALHIVDFIFNIMSPVTVCLQGIAMDYGSVQGIVGSVKQNLEVLRSKENSWKTVVSKIDKFLEQHDLTEPVKKRLRKKKRFMDEIGVDECIVDRRKKLKVEVFYTILDALIAQLQDRFTDHTLAMVQQMSFFTHEGVLGIGIKKITPDDIKEICTFYNADCECVCQEMNDFGELYSISHTSVGMTDIVPLNNTQKQMDEIEDGKLDEDEEEEETSATKIKDMWITRGFLKPYRCLNNFSGFSNLTVFYRILLSLAVTSCSAERAMSRVKIVKNRLRSCMGDAWLSNLMLLSSESDILSKIPNEKIIATFATTTTVRKKLLARI